MAVDAEDDYRTVGGMAMAALGRVPAEGDVFSWEGWRFEVAGMDGNRVDKVLATPPAASERSREGPREGGPADGPGGRPENS